MNRKIKKILLGLVSVVGLYALIGFALIPYVAKKEALNYMHETLKSQADIKKITFNPFTFKLEIHGFSLSKNSSNILFDTFICDVEVSQLVFKSAVIRDIQILGLNVSGDIDTLGKISFLDFVPTETAAQNSAASKKADAQNEKTKDSNNSNNSPWTFTIKNIGINNLGFKLVDYRTQKPFEFTLSDLALNVQNLSNDANIKGSYRLSARLQEQTKLNIQGGIYEMAKVYGELHLNNLMIKNYFSYIQEQTAFDIPKGQIDLYAGYAFDNSLKKAPFEIKDIDLRVSDVEIKDQNRDKNSSQTLIQWEQFQITDTHFDTQALNVGKITLTGLDTYITKEKQAINLVQAFVPPKNESNNSQESNTTIKTSTAQNTDDMQPSIKAGIKTVSLNNINIYIEDRDKNFSGDIKDFYTELSNIDLEPDTTIRYNLGGKLFDSQLQSDGEVQLNPLRLKAMYDLKAFNFKHFNAYLQDFVNFRLANASLDSNASIHLDKNQSLSLCLNASVNDFDLVKNGHTRSLVRWQQLSFENLRYSQETNSVELNTIKLKEPQAVLTIFENKDTNFNGLIKISQSAESNSSNKTVQAKQTPKETNSSKDVKSQTKQPKAPLNFNVHSVQLENGKMNFSDYSLPLPFSTKIHKLGGQVKRISSNMKAPSNIDFQGNIDRYGYAKIEGSFYAKALNKDTHVSMGFQNIALKSFSAYSGKFVGQAIQEGSADVGLNYDIIEQQIQGANRLVIKKIKLGDKVESNASLAIPLSFALALLEDKDGIIDLNLKVSGDAKNPDFNIGEVVRDRLFNLLSKIVTSPFSALGDMLGFDAKEIKYIDFEANRSTVLPPQKENLDKLIKILQERPNLSIKVHSAYHTLVDTSEKQQSKIKTALEGLMQEQKYTYPEAVEDLYLQSFDKKSLKSLYEEGKKNQASETLILNQIIQTLEENTPVSTQELEKLARQRAKNIQEYLIRKDPAFKQRILVSKEFKALNEVSEEEKGSVVSLEIELVLKS